MNTEKSVREIVEEWNAKAKAAGKYLDRDPWAIPPAESSLLDVPETAESRARIAWLQQQIADLQQQHQPERTTPTKVTDGATQEVQALLPVEPATEEPPLASDHA
jgi:hypothetical protein